MTRKVTKKIATSESSNMGKGDGSWSSSASLTSRPLLTTNEIERIRRPYLLCCADGLNALTQSPDISQWSYNQMLGMGDPDHNSRLRALRQAARPKREVQQMKLWDYKTHLQLLAGKRQQLHPVKKSAKAAPDIRESFAQLFEE